MSLFRVEKKQQVADAERKNDSIYLGIQKAAQTTSFSYKLQSQNFTTITKIVKLQIKN